MVFVVVVFVFGEVYPKEEHRLMIFERKTYKEIVELLAPLQKTTYINNSDYDIVNIVSV